LVTKRDVLQQESRTRFEACQGDGGHQVNGTGSKTKATTEGKQTPDSHVVRDLRQGSLPPTACDCRPAAAAVCPKRTQEVPELHTETCRPAAAEFSLRFPAVRPRPRTWAAPNGPAVHPVPFLEKCGPGFVPANLPERQPCRNAPATPLHPSNDAAFHSPGWPGNNPPQARQPRGEESSARWERLLRLERFPRS
jgi:hypothetical protein